MAESRNRQPGHHGQLMEGSARLVSQFYQPRDVLSSEHGCRAWRRRWWTVLLRVAALVICGDGSLVQTMEAWEEDQEEAGDPHRSEGPPVPAGACPASQLYQSSEALGSERGWRAWRRRLVAARLHALALAMGGDGNLTS